MLLIMYSMYIGSLRNYCHHSIIKRLCSLNTKHYMFRIVFRTIRAGTLFNCNIGNQRSNAFLVFIWACTYLCARVCALF